MAEPDPRALMGETLHDALRGESGVPWGELRQDQRDATLAIVDRLVAALADAGYEIKRKDPEPPRYRVELGP